MDLNDLLKNPEQIQNLITVLQTLLPKTEETDNSPAPEENTVAKTEEYKPNSVIKTKNKRRTSGASSPNKFESMSEFRMHKEDVAVDKALNRAPPVARTRDFEMINVTCRVCGKTESISPSLLFDSPSRYKCNNCSTQAG